MFLLFLCLALIVSAAAESICTPNFEAIGLLQSKLEAQAEGARQLVAPSETEHIAATNSINHQITWAKSRNCSYLLQVSQANFEKSVQVHAQLLDLNTGDYVFENV